MRSSQPDWLDHEWAAHGGTSDPTSPRGITEHEIHTLLLLGVIPPATSQWDEELLLPHGITEAELKVLTERSRSLLRLVA